MKLLLTKFRVMQRSFIAAFLTCFFLTLSGNLISGTYELTKFIKKTQITSNATLNLKDNVYFQEETPTSDGYINRSTYIRLKYTRDQQTDVEGKYWIYSVAYTLNPGGQTGILLIKKTPSENIYEAVAAINNNQASVTLTINSVIASYSSDGSNYTQITTPATSSNIPEDIQIELSINTENYKQFYTVNGPVFNFDYLKSTAYWTHLKGAEEYDLEWVFIDDNCEAASNFQYNEDPFNYKEPIRISTKNNHYPVVLNYQEGTVYFRVRGVGRYINGVNGDYTYPSQGAWSYTSYNIAIGFEFDKNMVCTQNFAEDGKSKTVVSYFDGLLNKKQTLSYQNSNEVLVAQTDRYDFEGRPAVDILPVPVEGSGFNYIDDLNLNSNGTELFDKNEFDKSTVESIGKANGAGIYYSDENPFDQDLFRSYIPNCSGYSYVHKKYTDDNTGRLISVSGLGPDLKTGTGHETRYFYSNPNKTELQRLFGLNVGNVKHYKKNYILDPNNQMTASYLDQEGRVIATCLVGNNTGNQIDGYLLDDVSNDSSLISVNADDQNEIVNDNNNIISRNIISIVNEKVGKEYTFSYDMGGRGVVNTMYPIFSLGFEDNEEIQDYALVSGINQTQSHAGTQSFVLEQEKVLLKSYVVKPGDIVNASVFTKTISSGQSASITMALINPSNNEILPNNFFQVNTSNSNVWVQLSIPTYTVPSTATFSGYAFNYYILNVYLEAPTSSEAYYPSWYNPELTWFDDASILVERPGLNCPSCRYDLTFRIFKPDGTILNEIVRDINNSLSSDCSLDYYLTSNDQISFSQTFNEIGEYIIVKELKVNAQSLEDLQVELINFGENNIDCPNSSATVQQAISNLDYSSCETTCEEQFEAECVQWFIDHNQEYVQRDIDECVKSNCEQYMTNTISTGECQGLLERMRQDVSSDGTLYESSLSDPASWWNTADYSIINGTTFTKKDGTTFIFYCDLEHGFDDAEYVSDESNWVDSWTDILVLMHPEYCQYEKCMFLQPYKSYIHRLMVSDIDDANYFSDWYANDPIFDNSELNLTAYPACQTLRTNFNTQLNNFYTHVDDEVYSLYEFCINQSTLNPNFLDPFDVFPSSMLTNITEDIREWSMFIAMYSGMRDAFLTELYNCMYGVCPYSNAEHPLVQNPETVNEFDTFITENADYTCYDCNVGGCPDCPKCVSNALYWLSVVNNNCGTAYDNTSALYTQLFNLCKQKYSYTNPFGMLFENDPNTVSALTAIIQNYTSCLNNYIDVAEMILSDYNIVFSTDQYNIYNNVELSSTNSILVNSILHIPYKLGHNGITHPDCCGSDIWYSNTGKYWWSGGNTTYFKLLDDDGVEIDYSTLQISDALYTTFPIEPFLDFNFYHNNQTKVVNLNGNNVAFINTAIRFPVNERNSSDVFFANLYTYSATSACTSYLDGNEWNLYCGYSQDLGVNTGIYTQVPIDIVMPEGMDELTPFSQSDCINDIIASQTENSLDEYTTNFNNYCESYIQSHMVNCFEGLDETLEYSYISYEKDYTLYYYDQSGHLVQTVPPEDVKSGMLPGPTYSSFPVYLMTTRYKYNSAGNIIEQNTPDGGKTVYIYNDKQQLRFSQNSEQEVVIIVNSAQVRKWTYSKYDALNRPIETGEILLSYDITVNNFPIDDINDDSYPNGIDLYEVNRTYYDNKVITPLAINAENLRNRVSSVEYFDYMPLDGSGTQKWATHYSYDVHGNVKSMLQENGYLRHIPSQTYKRIDYEYDLISGNVKQVVYQKGKSDMFLHKYYYDADNRITNAFTSNDGIIWSQDAKYFYYLHGPLARVETGQDKVQGTDYAYTLNGWLKGINSNTLTAKRDIGNDGNTSYTSLNKYMAQDVVSYDLNYFGGDYNPIEYIAAGNRAFADNSNLIYGTNTNLYYLYNGNISSMITNIYDINPLNNFEQIPQINVYKYDQLNRIKATKSYNFSAPEDFITYNSFDQISNLNSANWETFEYDLNGNITELKRYNASMNLMDDFTYSYNNPLGRLVNNKLNGVTDNSTFSPSQFGPYTYDHTGNLIKDPSIGVLQSSSKIIWNLNGKIKSIPRPNTSLSDLYFAYNTNGNRVMKLEKPRETNGTLKSVNDWFFTYYIYDAQGNVMATYDRTIDYNSEFQSTEERIFLKEHMLYGTSRLGYDGVTSEIAFSEFKDGTYNYDLNDGSVELNYDIWDYSETDNNSTLRYLPINTLVNANRKVGQRTYEFSNHLGNVLTTVSDLKTAVSHPGEPDVFNCGFDGEETALLGNYNAIPEPDNASNKIIALVPAVSPDLYVFGPICRFRVYPGDIVSIGVGMRTNSPVPHSNVGHIVAGLTGEDGNWLLNPANQQPYYNRAPSVSQTLTDTWVVLMAANQFQIPSNLGDIPIYATLQLINEQNCLETYFDNLNVSITPANAHSNYVADITSTADYYAFGSLKTERTNTKASLGSYRFGFNGKEKDDEVTGVTGSHLDFGARIYDSRIGRWLAVDPKFYKYPSLSSYCSFENSPLAIVDPGGDTTVYFSQKGEYLYTSVDGLPTAITIVSDKNLKIFKATAFLAYTKKLQHNDNINKAFRRTGITIDVNSLRKFYNNSTIVGKNNLDENGDPYPKGYFNEASDNLYLNNGVIKIGSGKNSIIGTLDEVGKGGYPDNENGQGENAGNAHTHANEGLRDFREREDGQYPIFDWTYSNQDNSNPAKLKVVVGRVNIQVFGNDMGLIRINKNTLKEDKNPYKK